MIILTIAIIFLAFFVQSLAGFGAGLVSIPLLSLYMPIQQAVTLVMIFQFLMGVMIVRTYKDTDWKVLRAMTLPLVAGLLFGFVLLSYVSDRVMAGILIALIGVYLVKARFQIDALGYFLSKGGAAVPGFLGGLQQTLLGTGGPPLLIYFREHCAHSRQMRATVMTVLFFLNVPRLAGSLGMGLINVPLMQTTFWALPFFGVALWLGQVFHDKIPEKKFYIGVDILLLAAALSLAIKYF